MKDNEIYDYIKKEAENITVPESLSPRQVESKLSGRRQQKFILRRKRSSVLAAAACLFLVVLAGFAAYPQFFSSSGTTGSLKVADSGENSDISTTYSEVYKHISDYWASHSNRIYFGEDVDIEAVAESEFDDSATTSNEAPAASDESKKAASDSGDYSETDAQVQGIMEGDIVKTDGTYIYTMKEATTGYEISIYLADGGNTRKISKISVPDSNYSEMYLHEGKLILCGNSWASIPERTQAPACDDEYYYNPSAFDKTEIIVYDISKPEQPKKLSTLTQSGSFNTSRISNGYLYTFTDYSVAHKDFKENTPKDYVPQINGKAIDEKSIHVLDKKTNSYLVMTSLNLDSPKDFSDSFTTLGGGDTFYVNDAHIYVTKQLWQYWQTSAQNTMIVKYNYKDGKFSYQARTQVRGMIQDSYYMHEYKGNFCFVYTRNTKRSSTNGLCVLDENLKPLGEISDLGEDERIYSSYYIDSMAYFVTFRETDPVFAVDLSNPKKPTLKSELKLPGFSSYLHSFGDKRLLGIGSQVNHNGAGGVKFSMFSIGKDYKITESGKKLLPDDTVCYADENHKAVFVDEERMLFGLAIGNYLDGKEDEYAVYSFTGGKFKKVLSVKLVSEGRDVRGLRIGNTFYVVDIHGEITAYDMNTWKKL